MRVRVRVKGHRVSLSVFCRSRFLQIDCDKHRALAQQHGVNSFPRYLDLDMIRGNFPVECSSNGIVRRNVLPSEFSSGIFFQRNIYDGLLFLIGPWSRFMFYLNGIKVGELKGGTPEKLREEVARCSALAQEVGCCQHPRHLERSIPTSES